MDKSVLYLKSRWIGLLVTLLLFVFRIYALDGFFIVAYGLGIFLLNLFIGFLSPQVRCMSQRLGSLDAVVENFASLSAKNPRRSSLCDVPPLQEDPEGAEDMKLPSKTSEEFRPFVRKVPEFKFWCVLGAFIARLPGGSSARALFLLCVLCVGYVRFSAAKATAMSILLTFFDIFDVPVFWPILLFYFLVLFGLTMKKQVAHMRKFGYVPWSFGKKKYTDVSAPGKGKKDDK